MKNHRYNIWVVITILLCCVFAVLFFPVASDNVGTYKAVLFTSIGVVVILLVYLVRAHIFAAEQKNK
ncbi:MAG: hypothetical protein ABFS16_14235 [Bacteroidota bacterium]